MEGIPKTSKETRHEPRTAILLESDRKKHKGPLDNRIYQNCRETKSHKQTTREAGDMTSPEKIKVTRNNAGELLRIDVREAFYTLAERLSRPCLSEMQTPAPRPSKTNICRTARARKRASSGGEGALLSHLPSFSVNAYLAHAEMFI